MIDYPAGNPVLHTKIVNGKPVAVYEPMGPDHRNFGHDPITAALLGVLSGEGAEVGLLHMLTDQLFDGLHQVARQNVKANQAQPSEQAEVLKLLQAVLFPAGQHINAKQSRKKKNTPDPAMLLLKSMGLI